MASTNTHVIEDAITLDGLRTFKQEADQRYAGTSTATTSKSGLMSDADKRKLDGIATGATANAGTVTSVATGAGLTGGPITGSGTLKADLKSETRSSLEAASMGSTASRQYAVGLDSNGNLSVNVPWENTTTLPVGACLIMSSKTAPSGLAGTWTFRKSFTIPLTDSTTYYLYERTA